MDAPSLVAKAEALRALHVPGAPLVLPNVWDASSARAFAAAGFAALATSSSAVADTLGFADGEDAPVDEVLAASRRIAASVEVPVTADVERGYGLEPAVLVQRLLEAGVVGCNLEDSDPSTHAMVPAAANAERLAAVRAAADEAGVPLVINARVDLFLRAGDDQAQHLEEGLDRARRYLDAGASSIYPILLSEEGVLASFVEQVDAPVNALAVPRGSSLDRLAELGVGRITFGGGLHRAAGKAVAAVAERLAAGGDPYQR
jgi:2-methylisocitrate lyase-like PEP mutase family enzyme